MVYLIQIFFDSILNQWGIKEEQLINGIKEDLAIDYLSKAIAMSYTSPITTF